VAGSGKRGAAQSTSGAMGRGRADVGAARAAPRSNHGPSAIAAALVVPRGG
jgi:hypothetical protein